MVTILKKVIYPITGKVSRGSLKEVVTALQTQFEELYIPGLYPIRITPLTIYPVTLHIPILILSHSSISGKVSRGSLKEVVTALQAQFEELESPENAEDESPYRYNTALNYQWKN